MSTSIQICFFTRRLRRASVCAAALGAALVYGAPTFTGIEPLPLVTELTAADVVAPEVKTAFDQALAACQALAKESRKADADDAFQALVKGQTSETLRIQALEAYAIFLAGDGARDGESLAIYDRLLAMKGRLTRETSRWLLNAFNLQVRQKQLDACLETARLRLALPGQSPAEIDAIKRQVIDTLGGAGRVEEAIALCVEVLADEGTGTAFRFQMGRRAAQWWRRPLGNPEASDALLKQMLTLPLEIDQRATVLSDLLYNAMYVYKPKNLDQVEACARAIIEDRQMPAHVRVKAASDLVNTFYGERNAEQKARPLPIAVQLLAEPALPIGPTVQLREMIQRTLAALGKDDDARAQAQTIYAATNAPLASRVAACAFLAQPLIEASDFAGAEKLLREPLRFDGLTAALAAKIVENIGRVFLLQEKDDDALASYREAYTLFNTPEMTNLVTRLCAAALMDALRFEDAAKLWLDQGNLLEAADVCGSKYSPLGATARELRLKVLEDERQPAADRARAYRSFLTFDRRDVPVAVRYHDVFIRANTNAAASTFVNMLTANGRGTAYFGDFEGSVRYLEWLKPLVQPNPNFKTTVCGLNGYAGLGRLDDAVAFAREALAYVGFTPQETYQLKMTIAALSLRDPQASVEVGTAALAKADAAAGGEISASERAQALEQVGVTVLQGHLETAARAVTSLYRGLYVPEPKKSYRVSYSETPITGIDAWNALAAGVERQPMDRKYGGNLEFLATDVATGNRGEGIGAGSAGGHQAFTQLAFICDVNGLHIRMDATDARAREIEAKLVGAGSYEGYIAPGENQPYICFLVDLQSGKIDFYNTTYETLNHTRIRTEDLTRWRGEHRFTDTGYTTYLFLSWEAYADKIPEAGDLWDFENAHWGRDGNYTWNGLKSIHGRSTWGNLAFNIPERGRLAIKRKQLFDALSRYTAEKRTSHNHEGVLDHWADPAVGDVAFYAACVKPLVDQLDSFIPLVKADMPAADVDRVFNEAVFGWNNIGHLVADLRRRYLAAALVQ